MPPDDVRIILVRPEEPGNVGAAARVMKNFGLRHLVLVAPRLVSPEKAYSFAHGAEDVLQGADLEPDLPTALAGTRRAFATTRRRGRHRGAVQWVRDAALAGAGSPGPVAWVFGPESSGLGAGEVSLCSDRVLIPTGPHHPSLNLAQAVAVCVYEIHMAGRSRPERAAPTAALAAEREALYAHLAAALLAVDFLNPGNAEARMGQLRRILERAGPTEKEVRLLRGVARQMERAASLAESAQAARRSLSRRDKTS